MPLSDHTDLTKTESEDRNSEDSKHDIDMNSEFQES